MFLQTAGVGSSSDMAPAPKSKPDAPSRKLEVIVDASGVAAAAETLSQQEIIAFDTEFLREKTFYPRLGLLQLADRKNTWLVDPLALSRDDLKPILKVLTDPKILKVVHAAEQDQECLNHSYGILAKPLLDTAIAAALTGLGDQIGLGPLLRKLLDIKLPKGHTRTDWTKRPLPPAMAEYAVGDVKYLVKAAEILLVDLDKAGRREWALTLSAGFTDPRRFELDADAIAARLVAGRSTGAATYVVLRELARWRDIKVRKSDIPRRWIVEDSVLLGLASARPATLEDLSHFRGLGPKLMEKEGQAILDAIRRGNEIPPEERPTPPRKTQPDADEAPAVSVLKCFLSLLAREHRVPARYVIDPDNVVKLLRGRFQDTRELAEAGLLKPGVSEEVGEALMEVLSGRQALTFSKGRVKYIEVPDGQASRKTLSRR